MSKAKANNTKNKSYLSKSILWLGAAVFLSAMLLTVTTFMTQKQFIHLQKLEQDRDQLLTNWGRLQLEHGALTNHGRVEALARARLGLRMPSSEDIVVLEK